MAKKKPPVAQFYLYSDGAQKRLKHEQEKKQLEKLRQRGDPRQQKGTSRA